MNNNIKKNYHYYQEISTKPHNESGGPYFGRFKCLTSSMNLICMWRLVITGSHTMV